MVHCNTVLQQEDNLLEFKSRVLEIEEQLLQTKSQYDEQVSRINSEIFINELQIQYETVLSPADGLVFESKAHLKVY